MSMKSDIDAVEKKFKILMVCTGNVCRSPLSEYFMRSSTDGLPIEVTSAGTYALRGQPPEEETIRIAVERGLDDLSSHVARQLEKDDLRANLILTLDRGHRSHIVKKVPRVSRITFTVREFARLSECLTVDDARNCRSASTVVSLTNLVDTVRQYRGSLPLLEDPADDDVIDPYGRSLDTFRCSSEQIFSAIESITNSMRRVNEI